MIQLMIVFLISITLAWLTVPKIIAYAKKKNLLDNPGERASHKSPTPTMGGIAIFLSFVVSVLIFHPFNSALVGICAAALVLLVTGIYDDINDMSAKKKLLLQLMVGFILAFCGFRLTSLHGFCGIFNLPIVVQYFATSFLVAACINAFNLIDGIDGLAGSIAVLNSIFACIFMYIIGSSTALIAIALAGASIGFLRFNFFKARIFMGDTGSMIIGMLMAVFSIHFFDLSSSLSLNNLRIEMLAIGFLIFPIYDALRTFGIRISKGKSPMSADKNHMHHILLKNGFNHLKSTTILIIANIAILLASYALSYTDISLTMAVTLLLMLAYIMSELLTIARLRSFTKKYLYDIANQLQRKGNLIFIKKTKL